MNAVTHRPSIAAVLATLLLSAGLWVNWALAADALPLVEQGKVRASIVLSDSATPAEKHGAEEIQRHVKLITGAELPILVNPAALPEHAILVGQSHWIDELGIKPEPALGAEQFVLETIGGHVAIVGGRARARGLLYGCYELLAQLGVRWYTPTVTRYPSKTTLDMPPLKERQGPAFEYREPYFTEAQDRDWAARNRINGFAARLDEATGGKVTYYPFVHTFDALVPRALFASHPEYFPLLNGKRTDGYVQRCLTNPEVLKTAIASVRQWIASHPDAILFSVSQNDTANFCTCDSCKEVAAKYGGQSGLYLWFVNQVAEAIAKDHPDKLIDTLAYQFTETPPTGIVPRPNVRVRLCPIACCVAHPFEKCSANANVAFLRNLGGWGKLTDTLYIWHYNTDFAHYLMPFPDFDEFPAEIRLYRKLGVKGIFFEGGYAPGGGASDAELRSWVMARLLWNPELDSDALVTEWMQGVYGKAWQPMRRWFDLLHAKARDPNHHLFIYDPPTLPWLFSDETLAEGGRLFEQAQKLAAGDDTATRYVAKSRLCLRYVEVARRPAAGPAFDAFLEDLRKLGITQVREGQSVDDWRRDYLRRSEQQHR